MALKEPRLASEAGGISGSKEAIARACWTQLGVRMALCKQLVKDIPEKDLMYASGWLQDQGRGNCGLKPILPVPLMNCSAKPESLAVNYTNYSNILMPTIWGQRSRRWILQMRPMVMHK